MQVGVGAARLKRQRLTYSKPATANWADSGVEELLRRAEDEVNRRFTDVTQTLILFRMPARCEQSACEVKAEAEAGYRGTFVTAAHRRTRHKKAETTKTHTRVRGMRTSG